ncbi:MAG: heme-copper oxidase subunit III [Terriglobia bacterium]
MATTLAPPKPRTRSKTGNGGRNGSGAGDFGGGGDRWESAPWSVPARAYHTGMWMGIAGIVMIFAAFTSALVVRRGISNDWVPTALPPILYLNTLVLLASSLTFELSRRSLRAGRGEAFARWLYVTVALGLAFVAGQLAGWKELHARGVYLATNPSSSFFYLLTAAHAIHLLGGIVAVLVLAFRAPKLAAVPRNRVAVDVTSIYWHFMDGLWIYLLILLATRL